MPRVICLLQRGDDAPPDDDWLSPEEAARLGRFRVPHRRAEWRLGRWTAKRLLSAVLDGATPNALVIRAAADGAPEAFLDDVPCGVALSISHRAGVAFCAAAPAGQDRVGCDVERIEPRSAAFVEDYLVADERAIVRDAPAAARPLLANLIWSAKESALKLRRCGLREDTHSVVISFPEDPPADGWRALRASGHGETLGGWWRACGDLVLTVVARGDAGPPVML